MVLAGSLIAFAATFAGLALLGAYRLLRTQA